MSKSRHSPSWWQVIITAIVVPIFLVFCSGAFTIYSSDRQFSLEHYSVEAVRRRELADAIWPHVSTANFSDDFYKSISKLDLEGDSVAKTIKQYIDILLNIDYQQKLMSDVQYLSFLKSHAVQNCPNSKVPAFTVRMLDVLDKWNYSDSDKLFDMILARDSPNDLYLEVAKSNVRYVNDLGTLNLNGLKIFFDKLLLACWVPNDDLMLGYKELYPEGLNVYEIEPLSSYILAWQKEHTVPQIDQEDFIIAAVSFRKAERKFLEEKIKELFKEWTLDNSFD